MPPATKPSVTTTEWIALGGGLLLLIWFQLDTWPVRFANVDDLETYRITQAGQIVDYIGVMARTQSRFYQLWNLGLIDLFNRIASPYWFGVVRTLLLGTEFALGGWLLARLCGAARYGWLFWVVGLGSLQIPPGFYPVLSYPSIAFGFIALLTAALAFDLGLMEEKPALLSGAAVCFFASMLFHEVFAIYALVFPLIWLLRRRQQFRAPLPALVPLGIAFVFYLTIYFYYRWLTVADHTYDGTTPSFVFWPALQAWIRYTFSVVPGFELWIVRAHDQLGAPLFRSFDSAAEIVRREVSTAVFFKTALVTICAGLLLHKPHRSLTGRVTLKLAAAASLPAVLACVPIALSVKYQEWALLRQMPYAYSFFTSFFAAAAICALFISGAGSRPGRRHAIVQVVAMVAIAYAVLCAQITNPMVLSGLANDYNAPAAQAAAASPQPDKKGR